MKSRACCKGRRCSENPPPTIRPRAQAAGSRITRSLAYLAAWDVHRAKLFGRCEAKTGMEPFARLVDDIMTCAPYASARRVFWVVDNGSSHRGPASAARLRARYPNLRLIHLPKHASWLNQIDIYFSIVQRKVLTPNDFTGLAEVGTASWRSRSGMSRLPRPLNGGSLANDLARVMARLADQDALCAVA